MPTLPWPHNLVLMISGRFPSVDVDLGSPPRSFMSLLEWKFTFDMPVRLGDDFRVSTDESPGLLVGAALEGKEIILRPVATKDADQRPPVALLDAQGEPDFLIPGQAYSCQRKAVLRFFDAAEDGEAYDITLEAVAGRMQDCVTLPPSSTLETNQSFAEAMTGLNAARRLVSAPTLSEAQFDWLVACPDPMTRTMLLMRPDFPQPLIPWAARYPEIFRGNPMAVLFAADASICSQLSISRDVFETFSAQIQGSQP